MADKTLVSRLIAARTKFSPVLKDQTSDQFGGYRFASFGAINDIVTPALAKQGLALQQKVEVDLAGGKVGVDTAIVCDGEDGEYEKMPFGTVWVPIGDAAPGRSAAQAVGSALSFARRYGLLVAAGVDSTAPADDFEHVPAVRPERADGRMPCNLGTPDCQGSRHPNRDSCKPCHDWVEVERAKVAEGEDGW